MGLIKRFITLMTKRKPSLRVRINGKWCKTNDDFMKMHEETCKALNRKK